MFEYVARLLKRAPQKYGRAEYFDTTKENILIWDSHSRGWTKVKTVLRNKNVTDWKKVTYSNGRTLVCTSDHPLPIDGKGRTFVRDIEVGDFAPVTFMPVCGKDSKVVVHNIEPKSFEIIEIKDVKKGDYYSYDVETESDYFDVNGVVSHNCRTRVMANAYDRTRETTSGRGNLSFTTINLPRIAIEARGNSGAFIEGVGNACKMVFAQLLERFEVQAERRKLNYPFLMGQGVWKDSEKLDDTDTVREVLKHGTLTVGFIGLAEAMIALFGKHHGEDETVRAFAYDVISYMRDLCDKKTAETGMNFTLIGTPAESLSGRFVRLDRKKYGVIEGVTDRDYYTNSFHVPVYFPISIFKKIDIEAPYHALCNGGHISYIELDGDPSKNVEAFEQIIRYMCDKNIGYGSINHAVDYDPVCGYTGIIGDVCPRCGRREGEPITVEKMAEVRRKRGK